MHVALGMLGVHVVSAPLWLGGLFPWGVLCGVVTGWCAMVASFWAGGARRVPRPAAAFLAVVISITVYTALQAAPLPCAWAAFLHAAAHRNAQAAAGLLGAPVPCTISMDHTNTWLEVLKGCGIFCSLMAAHWLGRRRSREVLALCALSALVVALSALVHWGGGLDSVFGLYRPRAPTGAPTGGAVLGPLMNANHLGGFLVLGLAITIGLALDESRPGAIAAAVAAGAVLFVTILLTQSRGAMGAGVFVLVAQGAWTLLRGRSRSKKRSDRHGGQWAFVVAGIVGLAMVSAGGAFEALAPLADGDMSKFAIPGAVLPTLGSPWVGVGRGATTVAILPLVTGQVRFTHLESFPVQWAFEWGPLPAVLLLGCLAFVVLYALMVARQNTTVGGALGLFALALQNVADYALEMAGVATVAAVALGVLLSQSRQGREGPRLGRRSQLATAAVVAIAAAAVSPLVLGRSLVEQRRALGALTDRQAPAAVIDAALAAAVTDHPGEPTFVIAAATHALQEKRPNAVAWINRAMSLAPRWAAPHVLAAQALWNVGARHQALMEIDDALQADPSASVPVLCKLAKLDARVLQQVLEKRPVADAEATRLQWCIDLQDPAGDSVDRWLQERYPVMGGPLSRMRMRAKGEQARRALERLIGTQLEARPRRAGLWLELARLQRDLGEPGRALETTQQARRALGLDRAVVRLQAELLAASGRMNEARTALSQLRQLAAGDRDRLASLMAFTGALERDHGERLLAVAAFRKAHRYGGRLEHLFSAAVVAEQLGDVEQALRVAEDVCRRAEASLRDRACAAADRLAGQRRGFGPRSGIGTPIP